MNKIKIFIYGILIFILFFSWFFFSPNVKKEINVEHTKVLLREVAHQLLLKNKDSFSLVLPILEKEKQTYVISFENQITLLPNDLVNIVKKSFLKTNLSNHYRISVIKNDDKAVAYSYEMDTAKKNTLIACASRILPKNNYRIKVAFLNKSTLSTGKRLINYLLLLTCAVFLIEFFVRKNPKLKSINDISENYFDIGNFKFYPEQNKLVRAMQEISLSKKECELLILFVNRPNKIIKRDELTKKVWEDNGVFVGRSLDTFISKLRKKLKDNDRVKIINIHGVGYKLVIS